MNMISKKAKGIAAAAALSIASLAGAAHATTIFDTGVTPTDAGALVGTIQSLYGKFTANFTGTLTDLEGYMNVAAPTTATVTIYSGSSAPDFGNALGSASFNTTTGGGWYGANTLNVDLVQGTDYWFGFSADGFNISMPQAAVNPLADYGFSAGGAFLDNNVGFAARAEGTPFTAPTGGIPEPATWALMIGGLGMAGAALRKRRADALKVA